MPISGKPDIGGASIGKPVFFAELRAAALAKAVLKTSNRIEFPAAVVHSREKNRMLRVLLIVCLLGIPLDSAHAQQKRERLDGFNGIRFGTTFAAAQQVMGAAAKETQKVTRDRKKLRMLQIDVPMGGKSYVAGFIFGPDDRLSVVRIVPKNIAFSKDRDACRVAGEDLLRGLIQQFGTATSDKKDGEVRAVVFKFADGNEIELSLNFSVGLCLTFATYSTPAGKKNDA